MNRECVSYAPEREFTELRSGYTEIFLEECGKEDDRNNLEMEDYDAKGNMDSLVAR